MESAVAEVRQLLASVAGSELVESIEDDDRFFDDRVIDSLHLMAIVDEFQSRFGIDVSGKDLSPENFGSIAGMAMFLTSRRGTTGQQPR
jgi:acyl carrier protein